MTTPESIIADVAALTGVAVPAIMGRRRTTAVVFARFLSIAALRKQYPFWSLQELACQVGLSDHGSAMHALRQFRNLSETHTDFRKLAQELDLIPQPTP